VTRSSHRPLGTARRASASRAAALLLGLASVLVAPGVARAQTVPGFEVSTYATVDQPVLLAFGPDGTLFAGNDPSPGGSTTPVKVSRIGVGGTPVTSLGNVAISDPDTIVLDVAGTMSGVPGTLLVSGLLGSSSIGRISGIHPDGTVVTLFDNGAWANVVEMKFDHAGRFLFTALESRSIWVSTGGAPVILATLPGSAYPTYLTIDAANRIIVGGSDNKIRIYNADGSLANGSLAAFGGLAGVECGPGGAFGTDLYVIDSTVGTLVRVDAAGVKTTVGTGFDPLLGGTGTLAAGSSNSIVLSNARPSAVAGLFIALSVGSVPFKGGTLKPFPFLAPLILGTSASGAIALPFTMPAGLPAGTALVFQWAIKDVAAVQGVALSDAVKGVTP